AEEFLSLTNESPFPVDVSGWKIRGGVEFTLKPGTVIPSNEVLYLSPNVTSFRARSNGPRGGQRLLVQGNYQGQLSARGEPLRLFDATGLERAAITNAPNASAAQQFLRITELMYHPAPLGPATGSDPEAYEYIELRNISTTTTLDLTGVRFTAGVQFSFSGSAVTTLGPGARVVVVKNAAAFASRYGTLAELAGQYLGALENGGERLQLVDAANEEILDFRYDNRWYPVTDGLGFSLVAVDENAAPDQWASAQQWRPSGQRQGSPAAADPPTPVFPRVLINEVLTHTEQPPPTDSIELFNAGGAPAEIGGWFLTDDFNTPKKFRLPLGSVLAPGGYRVFSEADFNPTPGVPPSFSLGADGDEVWLFSADAGGELTGYVHGFRFGPAENGVSFGRLVSSEGREHFVAETAPTLGASNAGPRVGPLVFSEILYHPPRSGTNDSDLSEFIEIRNVSNATVPLYDPIAPTNTWRVGGGVRFVFPPEQQLAAGGTLLLVNFDPALDTNALASFRVRY
ncbi:MAG TPA: lamin tail domain-containing protein, partial [Candidatus Dormibacteraeota bacterium]|nr:lamin tail domain-containing protein [Candidatus Dormibacteraeota bacterium]